MSRAVEVLEQLGVAHDVQVLWAHRMPDEMFEFPATAAARRLAVIIAGASGAAHLPGMPAAKTIVPVLGVPVVSKHLGGVDSLHSIVQMPPGAPSRRSRSVKRERRTPRCLQSRSSPWVTPPCAPRSWRTGGRAATRLRRRLPRP